MPPGARPTMMVIGLLGKSCARATERHCKAMAAAKPNRSKGYRIICPPWVANLTGLIAGDREALVEPRRTHGTRQDGAQRRRDRRFRQLGSLRAGHDIDPHQPVLVVALWVIFAEVAEPRFGSGKRGCENEPRRQQHRFG